MFVGEDFVPGFLDSQFPVGLSDGLFVFEIEIAKVFRLEAKLGKWPGNLSQFAPVVVVS